MRKVLFIFSVLSDADVQWLGQVGERIQVDPGTVLIPPGARIEFIYFVLEGRIVIRTRAGAVLSTLESGEIVGEMSLVDPAPTSVSVEAASDAMLLRIPNALVREKLASDLGFSSRFYRALCVFLTDRVRRTTEHVGQRPTPEDINARDELNEEILDTVHLAGARFERMLKQLAG